MRLSRTDLLPVMAIIGGGVVGVLASGSLVLSSRADYAPAPVPVVVPRAAAEPETPVVCVDEGVPLMASRSRLIWYVRAADGESAAQPFIYLPRLSGPNLEEGTVERLIYIDGVRMSSERCAASFIKGLSLGAIDRIEVVKEDAAVARFGEEASGGVMQIWLKHESPESTEPDLSAEPTFTPFTVAPSILNRQEVVRAMEREYPPLLRDAGIGGQVVLYFFIDEEGVVRNFRIEESSGHQALDDAALAVAGVYRFSAALNGDENVPVWVQFPVTFQVR